MKFDFDQPAVIYEFFSPLNCDIDELTDKVHKRMTEASAVSLEKLDFSFGLFHNMFESKFWFM